MYYTRPVLTKWDTSHQGTKWDTAQYTFQKLKEKKQFVKEIMDFEPEIR